MRIKDDQNSVFVKTSKTIILNLPMVEHTPISALPNGSSVEIQTHISSPNFNDNGEFKNQSFLELFRAKFLFTATYYAS